MSELSIKAHALLEEIAAAPDRSDVCCDWCGYRRWTNKKGNPSGLTVNKKTVANKSFYLCHTCSKNLLTRREQVEEIFWGRYTEICRFHDYDEKTHHLFATRAVLDCLNIYDPEADCDYWDGYCDSLLAAALADALARGADHMEKGRNKERRTA